MGKTDLAARHQRHWRRTRSVMAWMLAIWLVSSLLVHWLAKGLNGMRASSAFRWTTTLWSRARCWST